MKPILRPIIASFLLLAGSTVSYGETLSEIYELAIKNDATLKVAEATYRSDLEFEKQALSTILPQIEASASYGEQDADKLGFNNETLTNAETTRESDRTVYSISLTQNIFNLSAWFGFKQGKAITLQAEAQLASDQQALIVRVAQAYFDVLSARDNLEASKAEERATKRQLEQTQQRFDVGLIAITDVHEARAVFDNTVVQRLTDEGNLGTAYEAISVLTGREHANFWQLNEDFPVVDPDPLSRGEWVEFALKHNYALKASLHAVEASHQNARARKMQHAPTITGSYQYTDTETNTDLTNVADGNLDSQEEGPSWSVELRVPLFSGGMVSSQRRQAYEQYNSALQNKILTQRNVVNGTRASHITVVTDVQRVKARSQAIVSTTSALDATQAGYEVGTRNIVDVLQAQRSLYSSIRDYANSRYGYIVNMLILKQRAGI
ncbi:MAG: outer membrane protein, partial [Oceanicoccus sp.]